MLKGEWGVGGEQSSANYTLGLLVLAAAVCEIVSVGVGTYNVAIFSDCVALWIQISLIADPSMVLL